MGSMHLTDEQIQRLLHGELAQADDAEGRAHVAVCGQCRWKLEDAEREERLVFEHLRHLDRFPPRVDVEVVLDRARRPRRAYRWAAGILLALAAAGGAYALPDSPLPSLADRLGRWAGVSSRSAPPAESPVDESPSGGIVVAPGDRTVLVVDDRGGAAVVDVGLSDGPDIVVRSVSGSASFTTGIDRLEVTTEVAGSRIAVELPRTAPWVEIRAGGRRLLLKDGARMLTEVPRGDEGRWILRLDTG